MRSLVLGGLVDCISKRAELCPRRGSPARTSPPSRGPLPQSDTDLSAADTEACGTGRGLSGVRRRPGLPMSRLSAAGRTPAASGGTGGRAAALARSGLRAAAGLLVVFAALLTLPLQAQAQTVGTLVSNTGKTIHNLDLQVGVSGSNKWTTALGFTAGDNEEGYTLSSVQVDIRFFSGSDAVRVSIYSHVSGKPGSSLYVLTNPDPVVNGQLNTFTAPANATLDTETNYFVVVEAPAGAFTLRTTLSNAEDSGNASGWSIANKGRYRLSDSGNWSTSSGAVKARISIMGSLRGSTSESSDATLSDLTLSGGRLSPTFSSDVTDYTASVAYTASRTTVTAVKSEFAARIDYLDGDGDDLTDADTGTAGFQVDLEVGDTVIQMKVTAGDDSTTKTYKVTVTRAEFVCTAPDLSGRVEVWTATMTVGLGEDGDNFGYSDSESAGTLSDTTIDYRGNSYIIRDIKNNLHQDFDFILNKSIPVGDHDRLRLHVCGNTFDLASADAQTGDYFGWYGVNFSWSTGITVSLALSATASSDATLSALTLSDGMLSPSFASNVTDYTASAANAASRITVTAARSDSAADIDYLDGDGDELTDLDPGTDGHQVDLEVGENVIQVKLTAEDGTTTKTYRVTVTRAAQSNTDATLSALMLSKGTLSPSFASDVTDYTASVGDSVSRIAVTAAKSDSAAEIAYLDGDDFELADLDTVADGHQVDLVVGANTIKVQVTAGDGATTKTYAMTVTRAAQSDTDATLSAIALAHDNGAAIALSPSFASNVIDYRASVPLSVSAITVTVATRDSAATVQFGVDVEDDDDFGDPDETVADGYRSRTALTNNNVIYIKVTAGDGTTTKTYTVTVTKSGTEFACTAPNLSGRTEVWTATLTVGSDSGSTVYGYSPSYGALSDARFDYAGNSYLVQEIIEYTLGHINTGVLEFDLDRLFPNTDRNKLLHLCGDTFDLASAVPSSIDLSYAWPSNVDWSNATTVLVALTVDNVAPVFEDGATASRGFDEDLEPGEPFGTAVIATDDETLVYSLEGTDAALFDIGADGVLLTRAGESYDHETKSSYEITVKADDGKGETATIAVTVNVGDVDEPPEAPAEPTVTPVAGSTTSLSVTWTEPANKGPDIDGYDLRYKVETTSGWTDGPEGVTATTETLTGLAVGTSYEVQVRAVNAEGDGQWSVEGTGMTGANTQATGAPAITGTAELDRTLSAGTAEISDANGTTKAEAGDAGYAYAYQWQRVDADGSSNPMDIAGATQSTYTVISADVGRRIRVAVSFTDDAGYAEGPLTSNALPGAGTVTCDGVWCATLYVQGIGSGNRGCANSSAGNACSNTAHLSEDAFTHDLTDYAVTSAQVRSDGELRLFLNPDIAVGSESLVLHAGSATFAFQDADTTGANSRYWSNSGLSWDIDDAVELKLTEPEVSDDATLTGLALADSGGNTISLGETFVPATTTYTASVANGIGTVTVTAQDGATEQEYTITVTRARATTTTRATFVSNTNLTPNTSSSNGFYAQSFVTGAYASGYNISTVKVAFGLTSGSATRIRIRKSNSNNINRPGDLVATLTNPGNLSTGLNTFTAPANTRLDPSTNYWITVNEGIPTRAYPQLTSGDDETGEPGWSIGNGLLKRSVETVAWGSQTHSLLMEINGTLAVATAATGAPAITGTASLGQTLSAGTAGISDANGTTKAEAGDAGYAYAYQWQRVDADGSSNPMDIVGATQSTYTVISADVGSKIRVQVNFTDDAGFAEGPLTSNALPAAGTVTCDGVWCATLTAQDTGNNNRGCANSSAASACTDTAHLSEDEFAHAASNYSVASVNLKSDGQLRLFVDPNIGVGIRSLVLHVGSATFAFEDATERTGRSRYWDSSGLSWSIDDAVELKLTEPDVSTDATLSGLALADSNGDTISLGETFVPATTTYTASVAHGIDTVTLTATKNDSNATVAITSDDDTTSPGEAELDLTVGSNTLTVTVTAQDGATEQEYTITVTRAVPPVPVDIEPNYDSIGAGLEDLVFTLTREGATTDELEATVTIVQAESWLGNSDLSHTVTFTVGDDTATLTLGASRFSFDPDTSGNLTATVTGAGIAGASAPVTIISTADAPITVSYDMSSYTFAEDAAPADVIINVEATLDSAYPRAPSRKFRVGFSTRSDTAISPGDYGPISWSPEFLHADYGPASGGGFVARKRLENNEGAYFSVEDDDVYEGTERLGVRIEIAPGFPFGLVQISYSDGSTCAPTSSSSSCVPIVEYPVIITDEEDRPVLSLAADPASIAEEDDDTTTTVAENASVLTVAAASPKTFATEQTITLTFTGSAVYGTHYNVTPVDADANATGHQVTLPAETASVQVTVTATANDTVDGHRSIDVTGSRDGTAFGTATTISLPDNDTAQVTGVSVTSGNARLVTNWTAVDNATGYQVQWKSGGQNYNTGSRQSTVTSGSTMSHTITGLTNGTEYTVRVSATRTDANDGRASAEETGTPAAPGVTVSKTTLTVTEEDMTGDSYTVVLDSEPTANVTVTVAGHAGTDVTPNPATLTFTASNWDTAQTVTVTAGDDADTTDDSVTLTHSAASADNDYGGIDIDEVAVTVNDNDTAQVTGVSVTSGNARLVTNWTAVDNATGYQVQWKSGNESYNTNRQATVTSGTTTSHTITGLTNGTEYTVRVSATRTDANDGPPSAEETGTPAVPIAPGVTVSTTALTVTEQDPTGDSYTVALDTQPTATVTVTVAGHSGTDVTPNPTTLTFTASNWDTAQTVTVTAGDDADTTDDSVTLTHSAASADNDYGGIDIDEVAVTVNDNDTAQVTGVSVTSGNARLVTNWTAVDNATGYQVQWKSGNESYNTNRQATVTSGTTTSHTITGLTNGTEYTVRVSATRTDANDGPASAEETGTPAAPGVTVSKTTLTVTEEDMTGDSYTVVLDSEPTANVTVTVAGHSGTDVTPDPTTLTFTSTNWSTAQTVTVTAGDDADTTDDSVALTHSAASTDTGYGGIDIDEVAVTVNDNDTAQVTGVSVTSGNARLVTNWTAVDNATGYQVQWKSGNESYNTNRQSTVTSGTTTSHTITGLTNGTEYTVRVSATRTDANDGPPSAEETGTPAAPGVTVSTTALTVTEEDTTGDSYTVVLDSEPTANVVVTVAGHAGTDVTPNPTTLTFTASNWDTAQTVTVTAGNDTDTDDDMVALTHSAASADNDYGGIDIDEVAVTVNDNDTAQVTGLTVTPDNARLVTNWTAVDNATGYQVQWKSGNESYNTNRQATVTSGTTTSHTITGLTNGTEYTVRVSATRTDANDGPPSAEETGTPAVPIAPGVTVSTTALTVTEEDPTGDSYTVVLDSEPTANVTVTVAGHAGTDVTPNPTTLTFTASNWDTAQTVTVTAGDDVDTDDDVVSLTHSAASTDNDYSGIAIGEVAVTVNDNDTAQVTGLTVTPDNARLVTNWTAVDNATGYQVQWKSGNESYNTNRQATVTSGTTTSHTITGLTNGTEYTVRVSATRTDANDGPPSAEDTGTPAVPIAPGVTVSTTALTVTEEDTTGDSYTVVLDSEPTANVVVTVAGHAGTDVTPNPTTLTFTASNWDTAQTVTVTAGNDTDTDDDMVALTHSAASADNDYGGIDIDEVAVTVNDNDTAQVTGVSVTSGNARLVTNWTAVDNATGYQVQWKSGNESYNTNRQATVTSGTTTSHTITGLTNGTEYTVRVSATRTDANDGPPSAEETGTPAVPIAPGVTVSTTALTVTEQDPTGDGYTVALDTEPTANVTVTVAGHSGTDVTPNPTTLTFTASNWDTAQTVTVTAGNDTDTTDDTVALTHSAASADNDYGGIDIDEVAVTVNDNDTTTGGICGRTSAVRDALLDLIETNEGAAVACADVTTTHLAGITGTLDLSGQSIAALRAGDFAGLTGLTELYLYDNALSSLPGGVFDDLTALTRLLMNKNGLTRLPTGVFDRLTALTALNLNSNGLTPTMLPAGVFDRLTALTTLDLSTNALSEVPSGVFDRLTALTHLYLNHNGLTRLPARVFDGPTSLSYLFLNNNGLTTLPENVFEPLTVLEALWLRENPRAPFAPTAVALPDDGTVPVDGGAVRLDGSGSGGAWGTNVTYSWALTPSTSGVTFDDNTSATPEVTIPPLVANAELTFTLTVTGLGGTDGIAPATDTAKVTARATATGVTVSETALTVAEGDTTGDSYTVVLGSQPAADVTVRVAGHAGTPVIPAPATLTFTMSNWNTARTVTVTAEDDADTANHLILLTHGVTSTDGNYSGIAVDGVTVAVSDNDTAEATWVTVTAGKAKLAVSWTAVDEATGYRVQWKSGGESYDASREAEVPRGSTTRHTIRDLSNGTEFTVRVIAVRAGAEDGPPSAEATGTPVASAPVDPGPLTLTVEAERETVTEGEPVLYRILMSKPTAGVVVGQVYSYEGKFLRHEPVSIVTGISSAGGVLYWEVEHDTLDDAVDEADGSFTVRLQPGEGYRLGTPSSVTVKILDDDEAEGSPASPVSPVSPPLILVANARVREGPGAMLAFKVTLDRASVEVATVDWETLDGSAKAGQDYVADSGTLVFAPGETVKTVNVAVLDDAHDERQEVMLLLLSNAQGAVIGDAVAKGTIENSDRMPAAWLTRFGRAASDHVVEAVGERWQGGPRASHLTIGGRRAGNLFGWAGLGGQAERDTADDRDEPVGTDPSSIGLFAPSGADGAGLGATAPGMGVSGMDAMRVGPGGVEREAGRTLSGRAAQGALLRALGLPDPRAVPDLRTVLMSSSFFYSAALDDDGRARSPGRTRSPGWLGEWSAWGRTAATRFQGNDEGMALDGEVATAMLGFDSRWDRWLAGVVVSYSEGQGAYTHPTASGGAVKSTMTGLHPYARFELNERTSFWGVLGYGAGELSLTPERSATALGTDLTNAMAAFGGRTALSVRAGRAGRFELAVRSDARLTSTASDAIEGLAGAAGQTGRVRLMLEGSGSMPLATGGVLKPTLEAGLRYDAGDAETGAGLEVSGGLGYAAGRLSVEINARGLLAHEDTGYEEWGFSGSIAYTPSEDGRGLSMRLGSAWGATQSGVQSLWSRQDASGLVRNAAFDAAQRYQVELRYGFDGRKGHARWEPYVGVESGDGSSRALRLGVTLTSGRGLDAGLELGRRQGLPGADPEHAVQLRGALRW